MAGMQKQTLQAKLFHFAIEYGISVFTVACNRVAAGSSMHTNLVRSAGVDLHLH